MPKQSTQEEIPNEKQEENQIADFTNHKGQQNSSKTFVQKIKNVSQAGKDLFFDHTHVGPDTTKQQKLVQAKDHHVCSKQAQAQAECITKDNLDQCQSQNEQLRRCQMKYNV